MTTDRMTLKKLVEIHEENPASTRKMGYDDKALEDLHKYIDEIEGVFKEAAKRFFDGDASDLILTFKEEV